MSEQINAASRVSLNFELSLETGEIVDSNFDREPVSFVMGDGSLLPGFESVLIGLVAGDQGEFKVNPEHAFGQPNPANFQTVARDLFAPDQALEEGLVMSFANGPEGELPGVIDSVTDQEVVVNFNHPLAGQTLTFKVNITQVENDQ